MPTAATRNPPMTETIASANAAASSLFLGHNGEFWDFWLIASVVVAALSAIAIGVTTAGSIISHKREGTAAEEALERYKLDTSKEVAEANKGTAQAQLELQKLQAWRMVNPEKFNSKLVGVEAPTNVEILYVPECSDCFMVASMISALLKDKKWPYSLSELKKLQSPPDWMSGFPATLQHRANPTGVSVLSKTAGNPQEKTPANALMFAIGNSLDTGGFMTADETIPDGVVRIVIAPKI
jgi:hypothetical protein